MALPPCSVCLEYICFCNTPEIHSGTTAPLASQFQDLEDWIITFLSEGTPATGPGGQRLSPTRDIGQADESFIDRCFPFHHQHSLRVSLAALLQQPWLLLDQPEPAGVFRFLLSDVGQRQQQCTICSKVFRRGARALDHIRAHLSHRPFHCNGGFAGCAHDTCSKAFHSQEALKDHQRRNKVQCGRCFMIVLRKNLVRHQRTQGCAQR